MPAEDRRRRTMTAREAAEKFGVSPRTIRALVAEPRDEFLARAKVRREQAVQLRSLGLKHREIAEEMGCSIGTVGRLLYEARKSAESQAGPSLQQSA